MLTSDQIESLGWKHFATSANCGSKQFSKEITKKKIYLLKFHGDNFYYKKTKGSLLRTIKIEFFDGEKFNPRVAFSGLTELFEGKVTTLKQLKSILIDLNIDKKGARKKKLKKLNDEMQKESI